VRTSPFGHLEADGRRYAYEAHGGELTVWATDGISAAVGLHTYLRNVCGRSVGWDTSLPLGIGPFPSCALARGEARVREFYYLNFCTFSYTTAYWD
jgi:alpha-N-acetylglucosaminidase